MKEMEKIHQDFVCCVWVVLKNGVGGENEALFQFLERKNGLDRISVKVLDVRLKRAGGMT